LPGLLTHIEELRATSITTGMKEARMNHVFRVTQGFMVPDDTMVFPFLNSKDSNANLPWDLVDDVSLAVGDIAPKSQSKIHVHPLCTLITWVVSGTLQIKMKEPTYPDPYTVSLTPQQAALTRPGTFLQHINTTNDLCRVLYIVSPAFVFVPADGEFAGYDDAPVIGSSWEELAGQMWRARVLERPMETVLARTQALAYLQSKENNG
jgi:hypothetical protein